MGQKLALQVVIFVQFLYVARSTYMLTIVKTNDHEIKGSDYVVFASSLEKVHLVVARTQNIAFKRLICCAIAYVVTIFVQIWSGKTTIYESYFASFLIYHYIFGLEIIIIKLWMMHQLKYAYELYYDLDHFLSPL